MTSAFSPRTLAAPVALIVAGLAGAPALAEPTLDLSWDNCAPIISSKVFHPAQPVVALYCTATGMDREHVAYDVSLWFATDLPCAAAATSTPDAWRFDPAGCQSGFARVGVTNPQQACAPLSGATRTTILGLDHSPADGLTPPGAMRLRVRVDYAGSPQGPEPAQRRHVFAIAFDHQFSAMGPSDPATCGGLEQPICFSLRPGAGGVKGACATSHVAASTFTDGDGNEVPFAVGQGIASFGTDVTAAAGCFAAVPARASTWGAIKGQYRD